MKANENDEESRFEGQFSGNSSEAVQVESKGFW